MPIIGERDDAGIEKRTVGGEFLTFEALGDGPGGEDIHASRARGFVFDPSNRGGAVGRRGGIGHGHNRGEPSGRSGAGGAGDGFLVRLPRLAEVDMDINESRGDDEVGGVDRLVFCARLRSDDFAIGNPKVGDFVAFVCRVDDAAVGDAGDFFHAGRPAPPAQA